jgi:hypothetical protein
MKDKKKFPANFFFTTNIKGQKAEEKKRGEK